MAVVVHGAADLVDLGRRPRSAASTEAIIVIELDQAIDHLLRVTEVVTSL